MSEQRPLIGLTGRRKMGSDLKEALEPLKGLEADWYYADYARAVLEAGGLPVNLPLDADPSLYVGRLDGVLLTGGTDIGPIRYGAQSESDMFAPEAERDEFELKLLAGAVEQEIPVLGICRGLQMVNVFAGGTLHQDVPAHSRFDLSPDTLTHSIDLAAGSILEELYGSSMEVNSLHHQTVDRVGKGLAVTASTDGSVEGLEHDSLPIVAVQWHPEMLPTRKSDPVFTWLVREAAAI